MQIARGEVLARDDEAVVRRRFFNRSGGLGGRDGRFGGMILLGGDGDEVKRRGPQGAFASVGVWGYWYGWSVM